MACPNPPSDMEEDGVNDSDEEEPKRRAPWRCTPGTTVWARSSGGFPFWPARVEDSADDKDGWCFVDFLAREERPRKGWVRGNNILTWEEGVRRNYLGLKVSRKALDTRLQCAKKLGLARVAPATLQLAEVQHAHQCAEQRAQQEQAQREESDRCAQAYQQDAHLLQQQLEAALAEAAQAKREAATERDRAAVATRGELEQRRARKATEAELKDARTSKECCVCLTNLRCHAFMPCGHRCVCEKCGDRIVSGATGAIKCHLCTAPASMIVKNYE